MQYLKILFVVLFLSGCATEPKEAEWGKAWEKMSELSPRQKAELHRKVVADVCKARNQVMYCEGSGSRISKKYDRCGCMSREQTNRMLNSMMR